MIGTAKQIIAWILEQAEGLVFEIKLYKPKRSLNANSFFHVLCEKIAEATGITAQESKNIILSDYGFIDQETGPIIIRDDVDWRKFRELHVRPTSATRTLDDGQLYRVFYVVRGSHTYDTKEMACLINGTVQEAEALGIDTMPPAKLQQMIERWKPKE